MSEDANLKWQADRSYMAICLRALIGLCRKWEPDHSSQDDVRWIGFAESHLAKLETQYSSDKPVSPEPSLSDNERVMDLIRHCLDLSVQDEKLRMSFNDRKYCPTCNQNKRNYEEGIIGAVTCYAHNAEKSKTTQLVEALPPHIIERARNRKGE